MGNKKLSIRLRKNDWTTKYTGEPGGVGTKVYKGVLSQILHDVFERENVKKGKYKDNKNFHKLNKKFGIDLDNFDEQETLKLLEAEWEEINNDHKTHKGKKLPSNTKPFYTGVLSFSTDFMLDETESKEMLNVVEKFIQDRFGNYLTVSAHRDETSLHFHWTMLNYDYKNHKTLGNGLDKEVTSMLQDEIAEYLIQNDVDYGHSRGESKEKTKANHNELWESHEIAKEKTLQEIEELNHVKNVLKGQVTDEMNEFLSTADDIYAEIFHLDESKALEWNKSFNLAWNRGNIKRIDASIRKGVRLLEALVKEDRKQEEVKKTTKKSSISPGRM